MESMKVAVSDRAQPLFGEKGERLFAGEVEEGEEGDDEVEEEWGGLALGRCFGLGVGGEVTSGFGDYFGACLLFEFHTFDCYAGARGVRREDDDVV